MPFELTILGSSSATPTLTRHPSAQYLLQGNRAFLIDCGEGTQTQLLRYKLKSNRLKYIFISHLHPDHWLGLTGLLSTLSLKGRKEALHIFAPDGLQQILEVQFKHADIFLTYPIHFQTLPQEIDNTFTLYRDWTIEISCFHVKHRLPCWGFYFKEKKLPYRINKDAIKGKNVPFRAFNILKAGKNFTDESGHVFNYEEFTIANSEPASYLYMTDTIYLPELAHILPSPKMLYHEATFMHNLAEKATETMHSTSIQAAQFANEIKAGKLIIGHFSSRYNDLTEMLNEAKSVFPDTELALEGETFSI